LNRRLLEKLAFSLRHGRKPDRAELDFWLGKRSRERLGSVRFVGITGSGGKSTCAVLLQHLLCLDYAVAGSLLNNAPHDLARRLRNISQHDQFAVMEMSGHKPGVLEESCDLIRPHMGIVTSVSQDHYSNFRGIENTIKEKTTLVRRVAADGCVFLNADDPAVAGMAASAQARVMTFGRQAGADYQAVDVQQNELGWLTFTCAHQSQSVQFTLPMPAPHLLPSILGAIACAHQAGISLARLAHQAANYQPLPGRCSLHSLEDGRTVICDTVKAPFSTLSLAFDLLNGFPRPRPRRIVLGNVSDYPGSWSPKMKRLSEQALSVADQLIFHRPPSGIERIVERYGRERVKSFQTVAEIQAYLQREGTVEDVILLKSSGVNHLESLLIPWLGGPACLREPCARKNSCFSCEHGFARGAAPIFPHYVNYCRGLVRLPRQG
jgi:UDP-N-acetylmuramoyl-tripeptide--D-alanyl-D-alanine ligase